LKSLLELSESGKALLKNFPDAQLQSRLLLCKIVSITEEEFYVEGDRELTQEQERTFFRLIAKRKSGIPLAYLTNTKEFWSIPFEVHPGVLIPRPETELIVEKVIALSSRKGELIVDIGTGSGNIAIAMARELPEAQIIATDVSRDAIRLAKSNAFRLNIPNVEVVQGDLFSPLERLNLRGRCHFIVSNPPYVAKKEWTRLAPEIKEHEPKKALVAGETGLEYISELVKGAPEFLKAGGYLVVEMGYGQEHEVLMMFGSGWSRVNSFKDLSGIPRVIVARKRIR
jgi:release factor glutamine methyltransferase